MIPDARDILQKDFEFRAPPSQTYKVDFEKGVISGRCDGIEAVRQSIYKILCTERFEHIIYSFNYGAEFKSLYGQPFELVMSSVRERIWGALLQDDRIISIEDFEAERGRESITVKFTAVTAEGDAAIERTVTI